MEIDEPLWIRGKPTHYLKCSDGVLFPNRYRPMKSSFDNPLPGDVVQVEQVIQLMLRRKRLTPGRRERTHRLVGHSVSQYRDKIAFWVTQSRQLSAKHASGIEADCVVNPLRLGHWCVSVNHHPLPSIVRPPVLAKRHA